VELSGLEVAVEKRPEVIKTISKHLFKREFERDELPTSSTIQSSQWGIFSGKNWGLNRNATTRRKQKILDTAIALDSGDIISLGFNRVAHETAAAITDVTARQ